MSRSVNAHDDAVNSVVSRSGREMVFTGPVDGTVKVWKREQQCKGTKHSLNQTLLQQECAVTALAIDALGSVLYCGSSDGVTSRNRFLSSHSWIEGNVGDPITLSKESHCDSFRRGGVTDGLVNFLELEKGLAHGGVLKGHKLAVLCLEAAGNLVFSGSADKTICVWHRDGNIHTCLSILTGHTGYVKCLASKY
ncbi:hypothetical protein CXB51_019123 [Gossypium anomalum]|uniref:Uncharacterized protein n=1 Tax=Gossypium anomalum TaxID=47600 RepID=A0A8J6CZI4_9ROSI|nr:hypothetical protein CXB51_019123 [Gossypium anomalum]